jgi:hypothetical protein
MKPLMLTGTAAGLGAFEWQPGLLNDNLAP